MKLSCLQENLSKGLGLVGRAVPTRTTLPITNNVLLATDNSRLKLCATNLEIAISCWIGAEVEKEGVVTVPARLLTDFVNSLPAYTVDPSTATGRQATVDLSTVTGRQALEVRCARFQARISGMDPEDFPPIPQVGDGLNVKIEPQALRQAISQVVFAAATEDTRPVLTGVCASFEGDQLILAAADGFRLAVQRTKLGTPMQSGEKALVVIPARALSELVRLLSEQEEPVEITLNPNKSQVLFRMKNSELVSQLIQGTFPNYSQLIPQSYATRAVVSTGDFLRATKSASIFAKDGSGIARLVVSPGEGVEQGRMKISASAEEIGDNEVEIDAVVSGNEAKIAFNVRYLSDVLSVLSQEQVALETTTPSSPGVIRPVGSDTYTHVVMPMFVQW